MNRPEVICHMASTIDGKIAGESFGAEGLGPYLEFYGKKKQTFKCNGLRCFNHKRNLRRKRQGKL